MQEPGNDADTSPDGGELNGSDDRLPDGRPARERRSRDRVADNQKSGQGALSALSRLQMIERRRAALSPDGDEPD